MNSGTHNGKDKAPAFISRIMYIEVGPSTLAETTQTPLLNKQEVSLLCWCHLIADGKTK